MNPSRQRLAIFLTILIGIPLVGFLVIKLASGYRPDVTNLTLRPTGLLAATSTPTGAQVFIDGKLTSATDTTLNLSPGTYEVELKKDGFIPWKKTLELEKELVVETNAYLFPAFPDLRPLTFTGAQNPVVSPDGQKVAFAVSGASTGKDGLWILDLADRPFGLARDPRQILSSAPAGRDFSQSTYRFSLDSKQLLVTLNPPTSQALAENFLVEINELTPATQLVNITARLPTLEKQWQEEEKIRQEEAFSKLPDEVIKIATTSAQAVTFSLDETKILYTATASAQIPEKLITLVPAANSQPQNRHLEAGKIYVYDLKEDKNFLIMEEQEGKTLNWFPTSRHLFLVEADKIIILEYDNTNRAEVYTGPFENSFAFPFPSGNKLLILTSLGQETPPNLYAINLR
ncbi:MAG TPA: PEGA domain-containing protein [Candidatus Bathyarchaeia archaeon]|nr:PEGA domain-containing protein [Candidatus Bathyarchaeia archaeon]